MSDPVFILLDGNMVALEFIGVVVPPSKQSFPGVILKNGRHIDIDIRDWPLVERFFSKMCVDPLNLPAD